MKSRIMLWSLIVLIGWVMPAGAQEPQVDPLKGEAVYKAHCVGCHGIQGKGDGPDAAKLIVPPANFQRMESRAKSEMDLRSAIIWGTGVQSHAWMVGPTECRRYSLRHRLHPAISSLCTFFAIRPKWTTSYCFPG